MHALEEKRKEEEKRYGISMLWRKSKIVDRIQNINIRRAHNVYGK